MVTLDGFCFLKYACRTFSTSNFKLTRFSSKSSLDINKVGLLIPQKIPKQHYLSGQLFVHTVFAYRGIIICSFDCKVFKKPKLNDTIESQETIPFYQGFACDMTSYFTQETKGEEPVMNVINGMDCVSHTDILPYYLKEYDADKNPPVDHNLFHRFFVPTTEHQDEMKPQQTINNGLWLVPQAVYKETTNGIEVQVYPCLNNQMPAYQFSSHVYLQQSTGGHLWGKLKFEREDGTNFEVIVPTVHLDSGLETIKKTNNENRV